MKRWWIPTVAIIGFFALISMMFKTLGPSTSATPILSGSKIESAINNIADGADSTKIKLKDSSKTATSGEQAPNWGALAKSIKPVSGNLSFNTPKTTAKVADAKKITKKKKKKKLSAKKKKKKKNTVAKKTQTPLENKPEVSDISDDSDGYVGGNFGEIVQKKKDFKDLPQTLEEWEDFILNPPSIDALMSLIKYHQARLVSDDIFFRLSEKMVRSQSEDIRKFGIIALGSSPSLESFILLSYTSQAEQSSALITMITSNYQTYVAYQYLGVLSSALQSTSEGVRYQAAVSLSQSASLNIKKSSDASGGRGRTITGASTQYYQSFLGPLKNMADTDPNSNVRTAAQHAYDVIRTLTSAANVVASN